ncbi:hypothetical protein ACA910_016848 [Epithemia clementina (nom. ined.)]
MKDVISQYHFLDKRFRLTPSSVEKDVIAIPVIVAQAADQSGDSFHSLSSLSCTSILGSGQQFCLYSTSMLGNNNVHVRSQQKTTMALADSDKLSALSISPVEQALIGAIHELRPSNDHQTLLELVRLLPSICCPKRLELMGDDRSVVIPPQALSLDEKNFSEWLDEIFDLQPHNRQDIMIKVWGNIALLHKSTRVVRKGSVLPESGVRESNYKILWPEPGVGSAELTGPGSPGWITVTEQGIRQSFDLTKVMFSRGNVSEKIRFGKNLVQPNEVVLDMYGGIGYFTLPALVHGKANHVYVCEWNSHALQALRYNLQQNGVADRATVLNGDCRVLVMQHHYLAHRMDRVSLGLLPSSEGGWETAVLALKPTGGWLHIHGNVAVEEANDWALWVCSRLASMSMRTFRQTKQQQDCRQENDGNDRNFSRAAMESSNAPNDLTKSTTTRAILCAHLEKVKSFAPTINHYVADIYIGPPQTSTTGNSQGEWVAGMIVENKQVVGTIPTGAQVKKPSCALSPDGVIHQTWMFPSI